MNCPKCGASILDGASFCGSCGLQVGIPLFRSPQLQPPHKKDNKVLWIVVIVVILVVVLPVILAAVLYTMVLGFGGTSVEPPTSSLTKSSMLGGYRFTFAPMTKDTPWSDVTIVLTDGTDAVTWSPPTMDLANGVPAEWVGGWQILGALEVFANVTDIAGNGYINMGDYFTLTVGGGAFSVTTDYSITVMHDPSAAAICHIDFQG